MAQKITQRNNLVNGVIGEVDSRRPDSARYANGCEIANNALPTGGAITQSRRFGSLKPFTYRANVMVPVNTADNVGTKFIRNTKVDVLEGSLTQDTISSALATPTMNELLVAARGATPPNISAKKTSTDNIGSYVGPYYSSATPFWTAGEANAHQSSGDIKYVRAFNFSDGTNVQWGIVSYKTTSFTQTDYIQTVVGTPVTRSLVGPVTTLVNKITRTIEYKGDKTLVLGRGNLAVVGTATRSTILADGTFTEIVPKLSIEPVIFTIPYGLIKNNTDSMTLVGMLRMFNNAPSITNYTYTASLASPVLSSSLTTVGITPSLDDITDVDKIYVMSWGTLGSGATLDDQISGKDAPPLPVQVAAIVNNTIRFTTPRNIVVGTRRIGAAIFATTINSVAQSIDESSIVLGVTGSAHGGDYAVGSSATNAYVLKLDGNPEWYEATYRGVVIGTRNAEYLLTNEQVLSASTSIIKMASSGCSRTIDDKIALSCLLNGNVLFCAPRGIGIMVFSNEKQQYLPTFVNTLDMGLGIPTSIASSKADGCVYIHTNKSVIVVLNPETGGITTITPPVISSYMLYGFYTVNGEPRIVWQGVSDSASFKMSTFSPSLGRSDLVVRTSKFGAFTGKNGILVACFISVMGAIGGRVRIAKEDWNSRVNTWIELPYTNAQIDDGTGTRIPYTGIIRTELTDNADSPSEGKAIEIQFNEDEQVTLISVAVEMKEI